MRGLNDFTPGLLLSSIISFTETKSRVDQMSRNSNYILSEAEQCALDYARLLLGDNLSVFLLSGLGESGVSHHRAFKAKSVEEGAASYGFEMVNESEQRLPAGRDPLVLTALMGLLWERQPLDGRVSFRERDVLEKLRWAARDSAGVIKRALEKYMGSAYFLVDGTLPRQERIYDRYAAFRRLLVAYESNLTVRPRHRINPEKMARVQFLPELIYDVISERKYFLGIEFQRLGGIRRVNA